MFFGAPVAGVFEPVTVPAPIGGLNARDSLVAMPETDAIVLTNWWAQPYGCSVRKGYIEWSTGLSDEVETLATWVDVDGDEVLFAWAGTSLWDVTTRGAVGTADITGLTNARWNWVNLTNSAGNNLIAVNGFDNGIIYKAAGLARISAGDGIVANTWAGLNPVDAVQLTVHQHRLWAVEKDSSAGWYLPPDAIQGTFLKYDFGPLFSKGGFLEFLTTWTLDDGNGAEDHLIAVSSEGEAVVFAGTDPNDDTKWGLKGVYFIGAPVSGRRGYVKAGGDQIILTERGAVSMSATLTSTKVNEADNKLKSAKIQFLISELVSTYRTLDGWQLSYFTGINMLMVSIPSVTAGGNVQLVSNQIIDAWSQFSGLDASCWGTFDKTPYFGDYSGRVLKAWTGFSDNVLLDNTGGIGITATVQQAYSYLGRQASQKQVGMYRPTFVVTSDVGYNSAIVYDFKFQVVTDPSLIDAESGSLWGTARWGTGVWGGGTQVQRSWVQAEGMGVAASLLMIIRSDAEVLWVATDYSVVKGNGIL